MNKRAFRNLAITSLVLVAPLATGLAEEVGASLPWIARWQASSGVYRDVDCTQSAQAEGDAVAAIRDESSARKPVLLQPDPAKRAKLHFVEGRPVLRFDGVDDHYLASVSVPLSGADIWVHYRLNKAPATATAAIFSGHAAGGQDTGESGFRLRFQGTEREPGRNLFQVNHLRFAQEKTTWTVEGLPLNEGKAVSGTATEICLGGRISPKVMDFAPADVDAFWIAHAIPEDRVAEVDQGLGADLAKPRLVCIGDSITDGTHGNNGVRPTQEYPSQLERLRPDRLVINAGQWGSQIAGLLPVDHLFTPGAQLVVFVSTNDLSQNKTPEVVFADYAKYCAARKAAGWDVSACTVLPRPEKNVEPGGESKIQQFNALLRKGYDEFADRLIDFAADPRMGDPGDELDLTYFSPDKVHPNAAGYQVLAEIVDKALPKP